MSSLPLGHGGQYLYAGNGPKIVVTLSIYTVEASNKNQGLLMHIRKKDMINNTTIIMTFMMLEPLNGSPTKCEKDCQLIGRDGQLIGCDGQLIAFDGQLIGCFGQLIGCFGQLISQCFQLIFSLMAGLIFH